MPLSEYEQRVLDQLERDLGTDPKLGRTMARGNNQRGRIVGGAIGVLIGLGVVLVGAVAQVVPVGIAGFVFMLAAAMWAIFTPRKRSMKSAGRGSPQSSKSQASKEPFMRRVEERLARRREKGDL